MICAQYTHKQRCKDAAEVLLICPDGKPCPGMWLCRKHAAEVIAEYRAKLGQEWTTQEVAR